MRQIAIIKKITIDHDLKVAMVIEFIADEQSKENIYSIISLLDGVVHCTIERAG